MCKNVYIFFVTAFSITRKSAAILLGDLGIKKDIES